jgi:hypothetical protein
MIIKQTLYKIALISTAMILMLVNIVDAVPYVYIMNSGSNTI